jgi:hypothetical protein
VSGGGETAHLRDHCVADGAVFLEQGAVDVQGHQPRGIVEFLTGAAQVDPRFRC